MKIQTSKKKNIKTTEEIKKHAQVGVAKHTEKKKTLHSKSKEIKCDKTSRNGNRKTKQFGSEWQKGERERKIKTLKVRNQTCAYSF